MEHLHDEDFHVNDLCKIMGKSRSHIHRILKRLTGKSITQYIREMRLEEAYKLLQKEDRTISEVAYEVGFGSPSYFNSCFKQYYGVPPGEAKLRSELLEGDKGGNAKSKIWNGVTRYWLLAAAVLVSFYIVYTTGSFTRNNPESESFQIGSGTDNAIPVRSVAVLPLNNLTGNDDMDYLGDGMSHAVVSKLTELTSFDKIVPFQSVLRFRNSELDIPSLADTLGVNYVLEGNFQVIQDQIEIRFHLIKAPEDHTLWTKTYVGEWKAEDLFEIQNQIAEDILENLKLEAGEEEIERMQTKLTDNARAYDLYLKGLYQFRQFTNQGVINSIELFNKAVALDPYFLEAYLALSDSWAICGFVWGIVSEEKAWEELNKALDSARSIEGLSEDELQELKRFERFMGYHFKWDFNAAKPYYTKFMETGEFGNQWAIMNYARHQGVGLQAVLEEINKSIREDPNSPYSYRVKAQFLYMLGREEEALKLLQDHIRFFTDDYTFLFETAQLFYVFGDFENMHNNLEVLREKFRDRAPIIWMLMAVDHNIRGEEEQEKRMLDSLDLAYREKRGGSPAWFTALYYTHLKEYDKTLEWLEHSFNRGEVEMIWLRSEPMLEPVHRDPRYLDLYRKVGFHTPPPG